MTISNFFNKKRKILLNGEKNNQNEYAEGDKTSTNSQRKEEHNKKQTQGLKIQKKNPKLNAK